MFKKILVFLIMVLMCSIVVAERLEETNFSELNYGQFNVPKDTTQCKVYEFKRLEESDDSRLFLDLIIENYIPVKENVSIDVYLNEDLESTLLAENIKKENYIELLNNQKENNQIKVCVDNKELPLIIISNKSRLGSYIIGEIKTEDFYQRVLTPERYNNTLIPIEIYAENNSPNEVSVKIIYADEVFLKNSNLETVSGQTEYSGTILPGEIKVLKYYVKANKTISFATPQAKLTYTTEFGEQKTIYAKQQIIELAEKTDKIEVYVDFPRDVVLNEPKQGKIIIRNVSEDDLKNLTIETSFDNKITIEEREIEILKKYAVKEIPFETTIDAIGAHTFKATVYYNVGGIENGVTAQTITITADVKKDYIKEMIGVFLLITILVYVWLVRF